MGLIDVNKYRVYCKYGGDYDVLIDYRSGDRNDLKLIAQDEWCVIDELVDNFCCLQTVAYSDTLEKKMKERIKELEPLVTYEVLSMIESKQKPESLKKEVIKRESLVKRIRKYINR